MMKFASTRTALMGIALGAAGALCTLPLGQQAAAQGSASVAGAAQAAAGAAAKVGGISAGLGAASDTAASAGLSHTTSAGSGTGTTDHTTAAAADVGSGNDVNAALSGPQGNGIDTDLAVGTDVGAGATITRNSSNK